MKKHVLPVTFLAGVVLVLPVVGAGVASADTHSGAGSAPAAPKHKDQKNPFTGSDREEAPKSLKPLNLPSFGSSVEAISSQAQTIEARAKTAQAKATQRADAKKISAGKEIAGAAYKAGVRGTDKLTTAVGVAYGESHYSKTAYNGNHKSGDKSYGLWQINMLGDLGPARLKKFGFEKNEDLFDPEKNARVMAKMSNKGTKWTPWGAYTNGGFKEDLENGKAVEAVEAFKKHDLPEIEKDLVAKQRAEKRKTETDRAGRSAAARTPASKPANTPSSWITQCVKAADVPSSWYNGLYTIAKRESGFKPHAYNNWDVNAAAGKASRGLMQTIPDTFNLYHEPGTPHDIYNPVSNCAAAANYIKDRYGSINNVQQANPNAAPLGY
jgi:hypothetical protein